MPVLYLIDALLDRRIVRILMTGQAFRESFVQLLAVRPDVTHAAFRDVAVLGVAADAIDFAMFAGRFGPLDIDLVMAGIAGSGVGVLGKLDLQRLMHGMAFAGAAFELLPLIMGLVAGVTAGNVGVRVVAIVAGQLGMLAGELLQLFKRTAVTSGTGADQFGRHRNFGGCMGVVMASVALGDLFAMRKQMAIPAFGHQLIPVVLDRAVGMKILVAFLAFELMPAAISFKIVIKTAVALSALNRCERLRISRIKGGGRRALLGGRFFLSKAAAGVLQHEKTHQTQHHGQHSESSFL